MNLTSSNQTVLYGLSRYFNDLVKLYQNQRLPNKILFSGKKGIGKSTLAYHLINFILSERDDFAYDLKNFLINKDNKSFKLIQNGSNPNFNLIDIIDDKKSIDINQVRNLINTLNKSSLNSKPRFVLIDNIEFLNDNSTNALLKIIEEPNDNIYFLLIHNNKKILSTLLSRCLNFKISLSHNASIDVVKKLLDKDIKNFIHNDILNYYFTPGKIYDLITFSNENNIDLIKLDLKSFLFLLIDNSFYKKDLSAKNILYDFIELYLIKNVSIYSSFFNYFLNRIRNTKKFNLDDESLFIEFKYRLLNE